MVGIITTRVRAVILALVLCTTLTSAVSLLDVIEPVRSTVVARDVSFGLMNDSDEAALLDNVGQNSLVQAFFEGLGSQGIPVDDLKPRVSRTISRRTSTGEQRTVNVYYRLRMDGDVHVFIRITVAIHQDTIEVLTLSFRKQRSSLLEKAPLDLPKVSKVDEALMQNITTTALGHPKLGPIADNLLDAELYKVYAPPFVKDGTVSLGFIPIEGRCRLPVKKDELKGLFSKRMRICDDCLCPTDEKPVCGEDWITYANPCLARCAGVDVRYGGRCKSDCGIYGTILVDMDIETMKVTRVRIKDVKAIPFGPVLKCKAQECSDTLVRYTKTAKTVVGDLHVVRDGLDRLGQEKLSNIIGDDISVLSRTFNIDLECTEDSECGFSACGCKCSSRPKDTDPLRPLMECAQFCPVRYSCACIQGKCVNQNKICVCPKIYKPVCGVNGKTYSNECNADCAGVKIAHDGKCSQDVCIGNIGLVQGIESLEGAVTKHVITCKNSDGNAEQAYTSLIKLGDDDAFLKTTYFDPRSDVKSSIGGAAKLVTIVTCLSQVRIERLNRAVAANQTKDGIQYADVEFISPQVLGLIDVHVTSVTCSSNLIDAQFIEPSFCEVNDQCVRQRSCCECGKPTYVNKYHLQDRFCLLQCDCISPPNERYVGVCRENQCETLVVQDERFCSTQSDCHLQTDCCGLQAKCINRQLFIGRPDCSGILCPAIYMEPQKCVCRDNTCSITELNACINDDECRHLKCPDPLCEDGVCECAGPGTTECGNKKCEKGEELDCKDCAGQLFVTLLNRDRATLNERIDIAAYYSTIFNETLARGTCSMNVEVLVPLLKVQEADTPREVFSTSIAELDTMGIKAAASPEMVDRSLLQGIPMVFDKERKAFIGTYIPDRYGVHYITVTCFLDPRAPMIEKEKLLVEMNQCQQEGGHCINFQSSCKFGYGDADFQGCASKSEKCCVPRIVKTCNEECTEEGYTGGKCRTWPVIPDVEACLDGETLIKSEECRITEGLVGFGTGCCCKEKGEPCICPSLYAPICGTDGKTYANNCTLFCEGVGILHPGPCAEDCIDECGNDELCIRKCKCGVECRDRIQCFKAPCPLGPIDNGCMERCVGAEKVKCVFRGSSTLQECYSMRALCKGIETCTVAFLGNHGENVTWKSSCGGYAFSIVDGQPDIVEFDCGPSCTPEGEMNLFGKPPCCDGLTGIDNAFPVGDDCLATDNGAGYCTKCGDGTCGPGENRCNCERDCSCPPCPMYSPPHPDWCKDGRVETTKDDCGCSSFRCVKDGDCAKEGEKYSKVFTDDYPDRCCDGLTAWESGMDTRKVNNGKCVETNLLSGSPVGTCINCGNGECEENENICNCPTDCECGPCPMLDAPLGGFCPDGGSAVFKYDKCGCTAGYECKDVVCTDTLGQRECAAAGGQYDGCPMPRCPAGVACTQVCGPPVCLCLIVDDHVVEPYLPSKG
ncbi:MAG: Kazal-type serine protease inhibitor domain-containing protein [Candidatus Undinarchaeales archaeon]|jgi:hypothetical protein|nr:Kazal-type serine protease inhibitor domain-containing protein [Candidatus Undinarchaeales archaeon]MDP7493601.1 Kazal-type serine protease inhibitor domain-containing protein [Candidatus Undinarchaeales archaeon]